MSVDAFFISYNSSDDLVDCLNSFKRIDNLNLKVFDNCSKDNSVETASKIIGKENIFVSGGNAGYAHAVNKALELSKSDIVIVANSDTKIAPENIKKLYECIKFVRQDQKIAVCGCQQRYFDDSLQRSVGIIPGYYENIVNIFGIAKYAEKQFQKKLSHIILNKTFYVDGAFLIFNRKNFMTLSGVDESFKFYGEETEFCHRAHSAGYKVAFYRSCEIHHKRGGSSEHLLKNNGLRKVQLLTLAKLNIAKSRYKNIYFYSLLLTFDILTRLFIFSFLSSIYKTPANERRRKNSIARLNTLIKWLKNNEINYF